MWNPRKCDCECNKACKIDEDLDIENYSCEKRLLGKLVLASEDKLFNTTETSLDDKIVSCGKSNYLACSICVSYYFYYI